MGSTCRQHEKFFETGRTGAVFQMLEQAFTIALRLRVGTHRQASHLSHFFSREGIERGATENDAVMLDDREIVDLAFNQFAAPFDERAIGL